MRTAFAVLAGAAISSCSENPISTVKPVETPTQQMSVVAAPVLVISQIYGGGGNTGATLTNDFIELFNPGSAAVDLTGWSVQYASSSGSSWQVTPLSGTIEPGHYYLVQENAGSGGTTPLPTPDAAGTISMSGSSGKVAVVSNTAPLSGTCPVGGALVNLVGFGSSNCGPNTPTLNNTTAALRNDNGCAYTADPSADFSTGSPDPRNSANAANLCGSGPVDPTPVAVEVTPASATVQVAGTQQFTAVATNAGGSTVSTTFTWTSDNESVALVDANGLATGLAEGTANITATSSNGVTDAAMIEVTPAPEPTVSDVVISQVYGGGGNSGAPYKNDFVELFNRGGEPANVTGWRIYYGSSGGTTYTTSNMATLPDATIPAGGYYLVQLAAGSGTAAPLPTADAFGGINMSGSSGKVVLTQADVLLAETCPAGPGIVDRVNFGSANCSSSWGTTSTLSNTTAALRQNDGCTSTGDVSADFFTAAPAPRNSASPLKACDDTPPPPATAKIVINELLGDPANAAGGASYGEWFEVHNYGTTPVDLQNWTISSNGQPDHVISSSVVVPAGGYAVLGRGADIALNGGVAIDYNYFTGSASTIWLDNSDVLTLKDADGGVVDMVEWTSGTLTRGSTRGVRVATSNNQNVGGANWGYATVTFGDGDYGTPGAANGTLSNTPPAIPNSVTFSGRNASDSPLPVGFEDQLFATLRDGNTGASIPTTFTWTAETPALATIDEDGVIHAHAEGTAVFRATAADGTTGLHSLPISVATASTTAQYGNHAEFGEPADGDASDDFVVRRDQYTASYNPLKNIPNWVAYNLEATHIASGQDRCDCFTFDPELPASFMRYTTADYTGAGAVAGFGIDRGHLARSFDRTAGSLDNATTFYFSNIIPQASDNNQGPWAQFENHLGALAQSGDKEVFIIAGASGSQGTVKNEGNIVIPMHTWKVAVIMDRNEGLANVQSPSDVEVIAVVLPNTAGIRNVPWGTYTVTVDSVEALSGYDVLSLLSDNIETAVESNTSIPVAAVDGPYTSSEGSTVEMSAAGSSDADGHAMTYEWSFGDGSGATGTTASHTYAQDGTYEVQMIVTDILGIADTTATTATVANVAPAVTIANGATLLPGETYTSAGSFADAGADAWTATVNYGEGEEGLGLSGQSFALSHQYNTAGTFTVTVTVSDDDATGVATATVVVLTPSDAVTNLIALVSANSLKSKLQNAKAQLDAGNTIPAAGMLEAFINEVEAMVGSGRMSEADGAALIAEAQRIIDSVTP